MHEKVISQSEAYFSIEGNQIYRSGGDQCCYNLPKEFFNEAYENNVIIKDDNFIYSRKEKDGPGYILNSDYTLNLGPGIIWLIGKKYENIENKFIGTINITNDKFQIHKTVYKNLGEDYEWFVELYDKNLTGNTLILDIDQISKKLTIDILFNAIKNEILDKETRDIFECDDFSKNRIFFGAPGTGKSHILNEEKDQLLKNYENNYERVTFHPDYSYAQFVGTYKPVSEDNKNISYKYVPGPFIRILVESLKNPYEPYLLIIEEINRANVAAVFGDVFQLLDRDEIGDSDFPIQASEDIKQYFSEELNTAPESFKTISIPNNLFIWATMNSADQGVYMMDTAFKRRWDFNYISIDNSEEKIENITVKMGNEDINWNILRKAINYTLIAHDINEDKLIGPFFIPLKQLSNSSDYNEKFIEIFKNKVIMYLFEDVTKGRNQFLFDDKVQNQKGKFVFSWICSKFDEKGIHIFSQELINNYIGLKELKK